MTSGGSISIRDRVIADGEATYLVAEMACAHDGEVAMAHQLVDKAAESGADAIQLQLFKANTLVSPLRPEAELLQRLELPTESWTDIIEHARQTGLHVWATVLDEEMLTLAKDAAVDAYKIHASDLFNYRLLDAAAETGEITSLCTGGSTVAEIQVVLSRLRDRGCGKLLLVHGFQGYPTKLEDCNLRFIDHLKQQTDCLVGYQDHTDGGSPLAISIPLVAIGLGACVLEKHFTLDPLAKGTDHESSLDPDQLKAFCDRVREIDVALGPAGCERMSEAEGRYGQAVRKRVVAVRDIKKGDRITRDMLACFRSDSGASADRIDEIVGTYARDDIARFGAIDADQCPES